ncbi:DUF4255 domain-containing protein [Thiohalocapsa sp. ML1]|jgi:hypothetical protein|uniref:DUF4255 domain-containing protein n=1 Tax=Thiohalocapsa sp. ML1 TaxID=1431688 RepID=UPI00073203BC|nr:DUF4255 domain-containing protein [Thiohalocapsa sp. ML1]
MASFAGVRGTLLALEAHLQRRLPAEWQQGTMNARVRLLGSSDLGSALSGNLLGLYLYRIEVDAFGRNRPLAVPGRDGTTLHAELPVNLKLLLIANATSAEHEADLMAWAMIELANYTHLDAAILQDGDRDWHREEVLAVIPAELSNEDLLRLWDQFEASYTLTVAYDVRTVRLRLAPAISEGPDIGTRAFPVGGVDARIGRPELPGPAGGAG